MPQSGDIQPVSVGGQALANRLRAQRDEADQVRGGESASLGQAEVEDCYLVTVMQRDE
jgi:hypothetical protein